jgi:hypothetical protein
MIRVAFDVALHISRSYCNPARFARIIRKATTPTSKEQSW